MVQRPQAPLLPPNDLTSEDQIARPDPRIPGVATPEGDMEEEIVTDLGRRLVLKVMAALGLSELANKISFGQFPSLSSELLKTHNQEAAAHQEEPDSSALDERVLAEAQVDEAAQQIIDEAQQKIEHEGMSPNEALLTVIDMAGTLNFFVGIRDLLPEKIGAVPIIGKPVGHINSTLYAIMGGLSVLKYIASDEAGRHHLVQETKAGIEAFGIIAGSIVVAEGLKMDLGKAYEESAKRKPEKRDQVAIMTMLGSLASPATTTVGSSSLIRQMSNELTKTGGKDTETGRDDIDHDFATVCVSHISDLSGYLLFGDPPFIAVCETYGFKEGIEWQMRTMWPLALYSLLTAAAKLNYILAKRRGLEEAEAWKAAVADSAIGLTRNIPILAKIIGKSLLNFAKYFTGADTKWAQTEDGIQTYIGEVMLEKLKGVAKLVSSDAPLSHEHEEAEEGMTRGEKPEVQAVDAVTRANLDKLIAYVEGRKEDMPETSQEEAPVGAETPQSRLRIAIREKDFDGMISTGREMGIPHIEILVNNWRDFDDNQRVDQSVPIEGESKDAFIKRSLLARLSLTALYDRAFEVDRIKGAVGHNLGDVANVFPFQAGSVPFLTPMFKKAVDGLEDLGLGEKEKEIVIFFAIMIFSMMADNYVACKIGLNLLPEKPQIALIASIQGGSMTAIGNMANVAQFNLDDYPLAVSLAKFIWHIDNVAVGLAWSQALDMMGKVGFGPALPPKAKTEKSENAHAQLEGVKNRQSMTRRGLLKLFLPSPRGVES